MSDQIIQLSTFAIRDGKLRQFRDSIRKAVSFAKENGRQLLVEVFIDADSMRAHSLQIMPDSPSILRHWQLADPYISEVMESCDMLELQVFGQPSQEVLDGLASLPDQGVKLTVTPRFEGFSRWP